MSKAVICDRCKKAFSEQSAHSIEMKHAFITTHYDLCPPCARIFHEEFMKDYKRKNEVSDDEKAAD
jgi:hypothetical protein